MPSRSVPSHRPRAGSPSRRTALAAAMVLPFGGAAGLTWWSAGAAARRESASAKSAEERVNEQLAHAMASLDSRDRARASRARALANRLGLQLPGPQAAGSPTATTGATGSPAPATPPGDPAFMAVAAVGASGDNSAARSHAWQTAAVLLASAEPLVPASRVQLGEQASSSPLGGDQPEIAKAILAADECAYWEEVRAARGAGEIRETSLAGVDTWTSRASRLRTSVAAAPPENVAFALPKGVSLVTRRQELLTAYVDALRASTARWPQAIPPDLLTLTAEAYRL